MKDEIEEYIENNQDILRKKFAEIVASFFLKTDIQLHECQRVVDFLEYQLKDEFPQTSTVRKKYGNLIFYKIGEYVEEKTFSQYLNMIGVKKDENIVEKIFGEKLNYHFLYAKNIKEIMKPYIAKWEKEPFYPFIQMGMEEPELKEIWKRERIRRLTMDKKEVEI